MAFGFSKTRCSPIAIDFGADSLKLLQIIPGDPPQIIAAAAAEVPDHARTDPAARMAFYLDALKMMLAQQPFKGKRAVCSIPAYQTLVQHFQITKSEGDEMDEQIGAHLRERLNVDPSRLVTRCIDVGQVVRDGASKQEVICIAAAKDAVMRFIETAHRAKLDVAGMHSEPWAIVKAFAHLYRRDGDEKRTTCFIDLGASTTKVVITHGTQIVFAQNIHAGGDQFSRALAKAENMTFAEARQRRIAMAQNVKLSDTAKPAPAAAEPVTAERRGKPGRPSGLAVLDAQISAELESSSATGGAPNRIARPEPVEADTHEILVEELRMAIRYHQSVFPDRPVEKLIFLGGESRHVNTCQQIAKSLRIGAQLGDPLARSVKPDARAGGVDLREAQPGWSVPFGLCLLEPAA